VQRSSCTTWSERRSSMRQRCTAHPGLVTIH
jgi:hypothetical protein